MVAHAPNPPSQTASGLVATAHALQVAALVVAAVWGVLGAVEGVLWMPALPVAVWALWQRPGLAGGAFLALALVLFLPLAVFAYGFADTKGAGLVVALAAAVPPFLIAALLIAASRLARRARTTMGADLGRSRSDV